MQVGSIGDVVFSVSSSRVFTWSTASRSVRARFARHAVFQEKPLLEHTGPDLAGMKLGVKLVGSEGVNPNAEMKRLEQMIEAGNEHMLIIGGRVLGWHVIEDMEETLIRTDGYGTVTVAELSLTLTEYIAPEAAPGQAGDAQSAVASLEGEIMDSPLSSTFLAANAAAESQRATALDTVNGITAAVYGSVSSGAGFIADAANTATSLANVVMTPAGLALSALQNTLQAAESVLPLGLDGLTERVSYLKDVTEITGRIDELTERGPGAVRASLERAADPAGEASLAALIEESKTYG